VLYYSVLCIFNLMYILKDTGVILFRPVVLECPLWGLDYFLLKSIQQWTTFCFSYFAFWNRFLELIFLGHNANVYTILWLSNCCVLLCILSGIRCPYSSQPVTWNSDISLAIKIEGYIYIYIYIYIYKSGGLKNKYHFNFPKLITTRYNATF
jgi:hypothetical protein